MAGRRASWIWVPTRSDVSGRDAIRESSSDGDGMRDAETVARAEGGDLSETGEIERAVSGRSFRGGEGSWGSGMCEPRGIDVYLVFPAGSGDGLGFGFEVGYRGVWEILPLHAG